jgi:hypothetical protein
MPDGGYYLKIVASDAQSNPPEAALTAERESERFEIDNTPPLIEGLEATWAAFRAASTPARNQTLVKFIARDATTSIERAQYSVDGGDWILCAPATHISDAPEEHYELTIPDLPAGEHTIAVRAYDRFENIGSAKTVVLVRP